MKRMLSVLAMLAAAALVAAKAPTTRITIQGPGLSGPIEITSPAVLADFYVWAGPGTSSNEAQSLIIDWSRGTVSSRAKGAERYEVSFYTRSPEERLMYVVLYEFDPSTQQGYVYLPGPGDEGYALNVRAIYRGVEGHWFHAWSAWEKVARPLLGKGRAAAPRR